MARTYLLSDGADIVFRILERAERLEGEKYGKALMSDEVRLLKAADVLRKIISKDSLDYLHVRDWRRRQLAKGAGQ